MKLKAKDLSGVKLLGSAKRVVSDLPASTFNRKVGNQSTKTERDSYPDQEGYFKREVKAKIRRRKGILA